jgi:hypothetical protein
MTIYVLVHAFWCCNKIVLGFEAAGDKMISPESLGSGEDSPPANIAGSILEKIS